MNRLILAVLGAACLALVLSTAPVRAADKSPEQLVGGFHAALLDTMREAKALGYKGRYRKLAPHIEENFHLPLMIQVAVGSFWKKASSGQQEKLIESFARLSISTYASRFNGYSGQSFRTLGHKPGPQETVLVRTKIVNPSDKDVELTYVTRFIRGEWRIIDVLLDTGISELAVRRSEYRRVLKTKGIDGLIATIDDKANILAADNAG